MSDNKMLLVDSCCNGGFMLDLNEATDRGLTKFKGKFQEAEAVNKNKRMYPYSVLDENVKKLVSVIESRGLVGELDHPTDSIIHFEKASHVITKLWWDGNNLMGEGEILNTPHGRILKALINDGVRVGISSRGVGNGKVNENGILVIGESYKLLTFDAVADPSTHAAFQEKVVGKRESYAPVNNSIETTVKNEGRSIHRVNKEALIACLGGIKQKALKAKLFDYFLKRNTSKVRLG
jgi:hypothetical protein